MLNPADENALIKSSYRDARTIALPDGDACFVRKGRGPVVLLLHGAPLSLLTWRHNIDALAAKLDVIALDMKGFGRSHKGPGSYSPESHAHFVIQLLDKLGVAKASVVASSYGCAVAFALALDYRTRIDKLVLINSVGHPSGPHSLEKIVRIGLLRNILKPTLRSPFLGKRLLASRLRRSYVNPLHATPALTNSYFQLLQRESGERSFLACLEELEEERLAHNIARVTNETLIIWGAKDHVLPVKHAYQFNQEIRHSQLEVMPECGHFPHEEDPAGVNRHLLKFLGKSDREKNVPPPRYMSVRQ